jgi:integrase
MSARTAIQTHAENYLAERRRLGFSLRSLGNAIRSFARYVDGLNHRGPLTVELMADWARHDKGNSNKPVTWARRLKSLRSFARYLQQFEPCTEVPDDSTFGPVGPRLAPHIYTEQEIVELLAAARRLGPQPGLRGATYETLFGLLASTGLRVSEAVHLCNADVDLQRAVLTVRQTKFAKSRHVPLHPSTVEALKRYRQIRDRYVVAAEETPFFVSTRGQRLGRGLGRRQVDRVFASLRVQLGWTNRGAHHAPRVHDMRHSFVVRRVTLWQAQGVDVDQAMLALSTYVGHALVTNTYWYLSGVPQLVAVAAAKFESFAKSQEVSHD